MTRLVDMHMHAGFTGNPARFARELGDNGIDVFANTVTPQEFKRLFPLLHGESSMRLGLGLHPWWIGASELGPLDEVLAVFEHELQSTRFVGEIGLDLWPSHAFTKDFQIEALVRIAKLCAMRGDILISLHAVKAERELLDILEDSDCLRNCTCILHSYGGPSDQLMRAVEDGCLFSVGTRMLSTKRGREYARIVPAERLLIESDLPSAPGASTAPSDVMGDLVHVVDELASIRQVDAAQLREDITERSEDLLGLRR